ncbi:nociceptin receptor isoform X2 [Chiloscyllium punctatum]|uniref:nociceptin receptor isoform X2 n=1 Tax=Chiloscyllium punctatum TaxID=137246 RepID=UPI003B63B997
MENFKRSAVLKRSGCTMDIDTACGFGSLKQYKYFNDSVAENYTILLDRWSENVTDFLMEGSNTFRITIIVVYLFVCIVGLVGNCLVIYTKMKTATNIYIFNLALADALELITLPFQATDTLLGFWPFGNILCKIAISIDYYNMFTSIFTLTVMSVDRYIAVCHPVKALDIRTPFNAKVVNVCIWGLASMIGIPAMIMGSAETENNEIECLLVHPQPHNYWKPTIEIAVFLFSFVIPVAIITVCYTLMLRRLRSVRVLSGSKEKDRNLRRITRMVLVVVAVFVICWTPIHILVLVQVVCNHEIMTIMPSWYFCVALGYANSSLNPVLYAFLDENFKRCFKEFCFPSTFKKEPKVSNGMRSITKGVAYSCKNTDGTENVA